MKVNGILLAALLAGCHTAAQPTTPEAASATQPTDPVEPQCQPNDPCGGLELGTGTMGKGQGTIGLATTDESAAEVRTGRYGTIGGNRPGGYGVGGAGYKREQAQGPETKFGEITNTGKVDRNVIRRYLRRHSTQFEFCYEKELVTAPGLEGEEILTFSINASGAVMQASASGIHNDELGTCLVDVVKRTEFPAHEGVVEVRFPLTFHPTPAPAP